MYLLFEAWGALKPVVMVAPGEVVMNTKPTKQQPTTDNRRRKISRPSVVSGPREGPLLVLLVTNESGHVGDPIDR